METMVACPNCRTPLAVTPQMAGGMFACPACRQPIQLMAQPQPMPAYGSIPSCPAPEVFPPPMIPASPSPVPQFAASQPAVINVASKRSKSAASNRQFGENIGSLILLSTLVIGPCIAILVLRANRKAQTATMMAVDTKPPQQNRRPPDRGVPIPWRHPIDPSPQSLEPQTPDSKPTPAKPESSDCPFDPKDEPPRPPSPRIFTSLSQTWRLPTLAATDPDIVGELSAIPTERLDISVLSNTAAIPDAAAIFTERATEPGTWLVMYVADLEKPTDKISLATISLSENQFRFGWNAPLADSDIRRQVANCRLEFKHGDEVHLLQLRSVQRQVAVKIDLNKDVQTLEFSVADLPKLEQLRLEIAGLDNFTTKPTLSLSSIPLAKEGKIDFNDPDGAEIGVRFQKIGTGNLAMRLVPVFRENATAEFEMTLPRVDAFEAGVTKSLREAELELPQKVSQYNSLEANYQSILSTTPSSLAERSLLQQRASAIESRMKSTAHRVSSLQKQIPQHQARLAAVPAIRSFLTSLHGNATVRFRIVAEAGENDLVLVDGMSDAAAE